MGITVDQKGDARAQAHRQIANTARYEQGSAIAVVVVAVVMRHFTAVSQGAWLLAVACWLLVLLLVLLLWLLLLWLLLLATSSRCSCFVCLPCTLDHPVTHYNQRLTHRPAHSSFFCCPPSCTPGPMLRCCLWTPLADNIVCGGHRGSL